MKTPHTTKPHTKKNKLKIILFLGTIPILTITTSLSAFTDKTTTNIGINRQIGGNYQIQFLDTTNNYQPGNPTPFTINTTGTTNILVGPTPTSATTTLKVVNTSPATGTVIFTLKNAYPGNRPPDPGTTVNGADPYNVALFNIAIDGTNIATATTATAFNAAQKTINNWTSGTVKTITIQPTLPPNLANPYYFKRSLILGVQFSGSTT